MRDDGPLYIFIAGGNGITRGMAVDAIRDALSRAVDRGEVDTYRIRSTEDDPRAMRFHQLTSHEG